MPERSHAIPNRRAIVDRRSLSDRLAALGPDDRPEVTALLKQALADGRAEIARRLEAKPYAGSEAAAAYAFLTDQIIRLAHDYVVGGLSDRQSDGVRAAAAGRGRRLWARRDGAAFRRRHRARHARQAGAWTEQVIEALLICSGTWA
jgi:[protein-PII] uridylyltransferase